MNHRQRMLAGLPYQAGLDGLPQDRLEARKLTYAFNHLPPEQQEEAVSILKRLFGRTGRELWVEAPFHCDYGYNIEVGENFYANYNLTILDVGKVTIGDNAMFAPNVSIFTAGHPIHPQARNSGYEYGLPITIGDNVWIGGGRHPSARRNGGQQRGHRGRQRGGPGHSRQCGGRGQPLPGGPGDHRRRPGFLLPEPAL